jgi:LytS/YehU family sensor histidine kinase
MARDLLKLLPKTLVMGMVLGVLMKWSGLSPEYTSSIQVCTIFSVVMWGGFELTHPFYRPRKSGSPEREAMRCMGLVSVIYVGLLLIAAGLVRVTTRINLMIHPSVAALTFCIGYAVTQFMIAKSALVDFLQAERDKTKAEARAGLLALQSQLQPHTLFNALNGIAALIPEEPAKAEAATEALSRLLRRIMEAFEREHWTLKEEFSVLEDLLALERMRFGDRLSTSLELDPEEAARKISPLLLLPLVENALKHGFRPQVGPCALKVVARGGSVRVEDNGVGRDPLAADGLGLRTVKERLETTGGTLSWPETLRGCAVELRLGS